MMNRRSYITPRVAGSLNRSANPEDGGTPAAGKSLLTREECLDVKFHEIYRDYLSTDCFTIQWHITNECDYHCLHCYNRDRGRRVTMEEGMSILDGLADFCRERNAAGQVSFTGGNPFLHPDFFALYREASLRGFTTIVLGNPVDSLMLDRLAAIQKPVYYQVSLEGLEQHNDSIRGPGNFRSVMDFLPLLRERGIWTVVMLTLTAGNVHEVIPLARLLNGAVDEFTFNRLSRAGGGAALQEVDFCDYRNLIELYLDESLENPVIGFKDSLLNIALCNRGEALFGGCSGFGCGAAFNFCAVLPDGEVHACRKFQSILGNIHESGFADLYDSETARAYRRGSEACRECSLRPVCGGCAAVIAGNGGNTRADRDPYCFIKP
jgi:selenobiotic family peptide radical SAM maturase